MMTIGDREGRIFLSHPHMKNGLFFLLTTYLTPHLYSKNLKKTSSEILNTLKCEMVTSFYHNNGVMDRRAII